MMERHSTGSGRGHIFNMCSIASLHAYANGGAYSISKFALYGFSKNLREEMKPHGIKVTSVHPGAVMTDSWEGFDNSQNGSWKQLISPKWSMPPHSFPYSLRGGDHYQAAVG